MKDAIPTGVPRWGARRRNEKTRIAKRLKPSRIHNTGNHRLAKRGCCTKLDALRWSLLRKLDWMLWVRVRKVGSPLFDDFYQVDFQKFIDECRHVFLAGSRIGFVLAADNVGDAIDGDRFLE